MAGAAIESGERDGRLQVTLTGDWTLARLPTPIAGLESRLRELSTGHVLWDLQAVSRLDSVGAILLWRAWGRRWPASLEVPASHRSALERAAAIPMDRRSSPRRQGFAWVSALGALLLAAAANLRDIIALIGQLLLDSGHLIAHPGEFPWREFSANLFKSGAQALPVTALVGFLIGVVLSFLSSLQL